MKVWSFSTPVAPNRKRRGEAFQRNVRYRCFSYE